MVVQITSGHPKSQGHETGQRPLPEPANANAPPGRKAIRQRRDDQEFLPAALEILETPPSPVRMALISVFAVFLVVALAWAYFGRIDIIAIAQGKIQPPGRAKVIQPVETGKVARILVANGATVRQSDPLIEFDQNEARADVEALVAATTALSAEIARRSTALKDARQANRQRDSALVDWPEGVPADTRERELRVLISDLAQLDAVTASIDAQIGLKHAERERLSETIAAQASLIRTLQDRVDMRGALAVSGSGSKASLIDGKETLQKEEMILAGQRGQLGEAQASLTVLARDREKQIQSFVTENTQKLADAGRSLEDSIQRLHKARNRLGNMILKAPGDGIVQASSVYTVGQVVTVGQEIMRIVPTGGILEVEAYLPNKDIGFVEEGQEVTVKVESFPFTRYGTLTGRVAQIARDAIPLPDAAQIEGNPARPAETPTFAGAQRTQNLVFPVTVALETADLVVDGRRIAMSPGMTVTAEIKTSTRRILEYLFSPLVETTSQAMRER